MVADWVLISTDNVDAATEAGFDQLLATRLRRDRVSKEVLQAVDAGDAAGVEIPQHRGRAANPAFRRTAPNETTSAELKSSPQRRPGCWPWNAASEAAGSPTPRRSTRLASASSEPPALVPIRPRDRNRPRHLPLRDPDLTHQHLSAARPLREFDRVRRIQLTANGNTIDLTTRRTPCKHEPSPPSEPTPALGTKPPRLVHLTGQRGECRSVGAAAEWLEGCRRWICCYRHLRDTATDTVRADPWQCSITSC